MLDKIFKEVNNGIEFSVYLTPGAKKETISGVVSIENQYFLKIMVHAKPTDNQANMALIEFISKKFKIAKSNLLIKSGRKSRKKKLFISNFKLENLPKEISNIFDKLNNV